GEHERLHSPEEIRMLVEKSTEGGSMLKEDARLLEGVFEFSEKTAQEVMTPRTQMIALEANMSVEDAADEVAVARRSRYPVYAEYDPQDRAASGDGAQRLDGAMPITEFNTLYDAALDDADYTTLGGYVFGQLGRLPRPGDRVTAGPHIFEVVEMEGRRVKSLRLHTAPPVELEHGKPRHTERSEGSGR